MATRQKAKKRASRTQKKSVVKNPLIVLVVFCIALISAVYFDYVPPEILEQLPPALQEIIVRLLPVPENPDLSTIPTGPGNTTVESFDKAKRYLLNMHINANQMQTFYCGSRFDGQKNVYHDASGYKPATTDTFRETHLEWEHVVPAYKFGKTFPYWTEFGAPPHPECFDKKGKPINNRECTEKNSPQYRLMQADMHNLRPETGALNGLRSNNDFGMIPGEKRQFGACDMEIDSDRNLTEPPERVRGDIGRTYLYMASAYPEVKFLSASELQMMQAWAQADPVDAWECERERLIAKMQGNRNAVVKTACEQAGL